MDMEKTSAVVLTDLHLLIAAGTAPARKPTHARILLKADQGPAGPAWSDVAIAGAGEVHPATVGRVRRSFGEGGLDAALNRKAPNRVYPRRLDGAAEAHLVTVACGDPPAGRERRTRRLLADELVRREVVEEVAPPRPSGNPSSQRPQTVAEGAVVPSARGERRVRLADGGCAGHRPATGRSGPAPDLPRRDQPPGTGCRASGAPRGARTPGTAGSRRPARRSRKLGSGHGAVARLAAGASQHPADADRLGARCAGAGRCPLPRLARRGLPARRGHADRQPP